MAQRGPHDCLVAATAMVTGATYEAALAAYGELDERGYVRGTFGQALARLDHTVLTQITPAFSTIAACSPAIAVVVKKGARPLHTHAVALERELVFDPEDTTKSSLGAYERVAFLAPIITEAMNDMLDAELFEAQAWWVNGEGV